TTRRGVAVLADDVRERGQRCRGHDRRGTRRGTRRRRRHRTRCWRRGRERGRGRRVGRVRRGSRGHLLDVRARGRSLRGGGAEPARRGGRLGGGGGLRGGGAPVEGLGGVGRRPRRGRDRLRGRLGDRVGLERGDRLLGRPRSVLLRGGRRCVAG